MEQEQSVEEMVAKRMTELPADVQEAILSADLDKKIHEIAQKNGLHIDQTGALQDATLLVMLGFSDAGEFPSQLEEALHINAEKALKLASNINQEIFSTVRESMKRFSAVRAAAAAPEEPVSEPTAVAAAPAFFAAKKLPPLSEPAPVVPTKVPEPSLPDVEYLLTQKTSAAPATTPAIPAPIVPAPIASATPPPPPADYKADPYREPVK